MTESNPEEKCARPSSKHEFLNRLMSVMPGWKSHLMFWTIVVVGLAVDLWTKSAIFNWLEQKPGNSFSVIDGFLQLVRTFNPGAAFGIAAGRFYLLVIVSIIALVVILVVFLLSGSQRKLVHIALAFLTAGICGNLYDRIFNNGFVRDFIDVVYWPGRHWPAFNIADSLLCIGVALLMISSFWAPSKRT